MSVMEREVIQDNDLGTVTKQLLGALTALKKGDSSVRLPLEWTGLPGKLSECFNDELPGIISSATD